MFSQYKLNTILTGVSSYVITGMWLRAYISQTECSLIEVSSLPLCVFPRLKKVADTGLALLLGENMELFLDYASLSHASHSTLELMNFIIF